MNLLIFGMIGDAVKDTWYSICILINNAVYSVITALYNVFISVANVNLFSETAFNKIIKRIYIVMGIAMLFIFAYNLVLMIINPDDKKGTGQMTKMIKETIISLVLIILLPTLFNYMAIMQKHLLNSNIIGSIILGDTGGTAQENCEMYKDENFNIITDNTDINAREVRWEYTLAGTVGGAAAGVGLPGALAGFIGGGFVTIADYLFQDPQTAEEDLYNNCMIYNKMSDSSRGAASIAPTLFTAFYHPVDFGYSECADYIESCGDDEDGCFTEYIGENGKNVEMCAYYYYDATMAKFTGNLTPFINEMYFFRAAKEDNKFEFNFLLAFVAGCLAVYMFACYTLSIGVRVAKLGFLQIISPITVMMRIIPKKKETIYDKWQKMLIDTYLDVFIRLTIIYFALFAISLVPDVINSLFQTLEGGFLVKALSMVVVILGILKFAQDAPGLFKEFFGSGGTFALKSPKKQFNENKYAKGIVGAATGSTLGLASGIAKGKPISVIGGLFRGGKNGARNMAGADLTKKGTFVEGVKNSKYQTDYELSHSKFKAIRSGIKQKGGIVEYVKSQGTEFVDFLKDNNSQSEKFGAANKLFADSAIIDNIIINGIIKDETSAKEAWAANKPVALGDNYYRRDDTKGVWVNNNGREYLKSEMKKEMDSYYNKTKISQIAEALSKNDKGQQISFKQWAEDFNKTLLDNFPKLANDVSDTFFKTISNEGGIEIKSTNDLIAKMDELQKKGIAGDRSSFEQLATLKVAMDKGLKNIKDSSYDMNQKKK